MPEFSFRLRFVIANNEQINLEVSHIEIPEIWPFPVLFQSAETGQTVQSSAHLVFKAEGFQSEQDALAAGEACRDSLIVALADMKIGVDFGDRAPSSGFFRPGLAMLEAQVGARVLNDQHGLMVFESDPPPRFARLGPVRGIRGRTEDTFIATLKRSAHDRPFLSDRDRLAFDLFAASYFQASQDARLILLVIAIECLIQTLPRDQTAITHVEKLIEATRRAVELSQSDKDSIEGALQWLRSESIGQAARRIVDAVLPDKEYSGMPSARFVAHAYDVRSRLVHGSQPFPTRDEVSSTASTLETLVGDLISAPYIRRAS